MYLNINMTKNTENVYQKTKNDAQRHTIDKNLEEGGSSTWEQSVTNATGALTWLKSTLKCR